MYTISISDNQSINLKNRQNIQYPQKKSLNFWIITKKPSYRLIRLYSKIFCCLFIVEQSYENKRRNISNTFLSFDISVISCTVFIFNRWIYRSKPLFFLHSSRLNVNSWKIDQCKSDIIIYTIYFSYNNQTFISIKI